MSTTNTTNTTDATAAERQLRIVAAKVEHMLGQMKALIASYPDIRTAEIRALILSLEEKLAQIHRALAQL